jgi:hypothetical protein
MLLWFLSPKKQFLSKTHRSKCKSYSSNCSKAGIIRTEAALRVLFFKGVGADYKWNNIRVSQLACYLYSHVSKLNMF